MNNRAFLRKLKRKTNTEYKANTRLMYKTQITEKFYECLNERLKDEELKQNPKMLWKLVNDDWNQWIAQRMKEKNTDKQLFRSVLESAKMIINRDFQARRDAMEANK